MKTLNKNTQSDEEKEFVTSANFFDFSFAQTHKISFKRNRLNLGFIMKKIFRIIFVLFIDKGEKSE